MNYKNKEGYHDPTAAAAIEEASKPPQKVRKLIHLLREVADALGYEMKGRVWLKDKESGEEYR